MIWKPKPLEDFTHRYSNVMDPAADFIHSAVNAVKYAENAGNACYWAPEVPKEARVTYKYSFKGTTKTAWLDAILWSYNLGEAASERARSGHPKTEKTDSDYRCPDSDLKDAPTTYGSICLRLFWGHELWLQTRM